MLLLLLTVAVGAPLFPVTDLAQLVEKENTLALRFRDRLHDPESTRRLFKFF